MTGGESAAFVRIAQLVERSVKPVKPERSQVQILLLTLFYACTELVATVQYSLAGCLIVDPNQQPAFFFLSFG